MIGAARHLRRTVALLGLLLLCAALLPAASSADFGIQPGSVKIETLNAAGEPDMRAGAHPDRLDMEFKIETTGGTGARNLHFEFAPGLSGSPIATPTCDRVIFEFNECPKDTQVGIFKATFYFTGERFNQPVYNLTPAPGQLAALGFKPFWETELEMALRPGDFGLNIVTDDMPQLPFNEGRIELWGVPADHNGGGAERKPFLTTPTACGPLTFMVKTRSWEVGSQWVQEEGESLPFEGCQQLPFEPSLGLQLTNPKPDSPTGARVDINLKEHSGPDERESASLRNVSIDFPPGVSVSPGGVEGRDVCSDEQFKLGTADPVACPFQSKVGTVEVNTPQIGQNLTGSIYLGHERPGERFRLFIAAAGAGVTYKSIANLSADSSTGRLSTALNNLPQFSAKQISLEFEGGPRALLATPISCGPATARARFTPYSGAPPAESAATVNIGSGSCSPPFSPGLVAGSTELAAGHSTAFSLTLSRQEAEQLPGKFSTTLPPGLTANLTAVALCRNASADAGNCSDASKIGNAVGEVGPGPNPAKVNGAVYLTESYKGAPFGLAIVFRAAIGPFDLGTLSVRATLKIDPHTGQVTIEHLLPSVFEGIPLRFRTIGIDLSRSGFLINPTSCEAEKLTSTVYSVDGRAANVTDPFHVNGCDSLGFKPTFAVALDQKGKRAKNPQLSFAVTVPKGQANLQRLKVKFPRFLKFHNAGLKEICNRGDAAEGRCRPGSQVGTAVAKSPVIGEPLTGPVYVVQPKDKGFPDLWSDVEGMGVKLQLKSESSGNNGNLITEMVEIPDLPLASFTMSVNGGGKKGALFSVGRAGCSKPGALATAAELEGHTGAVVSTNVQMKATCAKSSGKKPSRKKRAAKRVAHRGGR